ncbi:MAG: type II secretion system protein, partial [Myxococcales bacterium]|nr:type II secretion system protein [Myxococcales bacterium]
MMVVIGIIGLLMGAAIFSVRSVTKADLRSAASRTAATFRFAFDRATMTGNTIRVAMDFDKGQIWLEMSKGRVAVRKGSEQHHTTNADEAKDPDADDDDNPKSSPLGGLGLGGAKGSAAAGGDDDDSGGLFGIDTAKLKAQYERDLAPAARPKVLFKPIKKKKLKFAKNISFATVMTPRMLDPQKKGIGYVYFFPQGHSEQAIVHLSTADGEDYYSVVLHPLTGRTKVYGCKVTIPSDYGDNDPDARRRRRRKRKSLCEED